MRVPLGFVTALLFILFSRPGWSTLAAGAPVALAGAMIRGWASGHLRKNAELATGGPYAHTRNPLYFGSFVMLLGCAVAGGVWWLGLWLLVFFFMIYWPVMQAEAGHMKSLFGSDYETWARETPLFFPGLSPYKSPDNRSFDRRQYLRHREYRALVGLAIIFGVLALKTAIKL